MEITLIAQVPPKLTRPSLDPVNDTFIVQAGLLYDYYPVKLKPHIPDKFLKIEISPPLLAEGFICYEKKLYQVSVKDLLRRVVNVSNEFRKPVDFGESKPELSKRRKVALQRQAQSRPDGDIGLEICEDANLAFENQVDSLLSLVTAKTGESWEIQGNS